MNTRWGPREGHSHRGVHPSLNQDLVHAFGAGPALGSWAQNAEQGSVLDVEKLPPGNPGTFVHFLL